MTKENIWADLNSITLKKNNLGSVGMAVLINCRSFLCPVFNVRISRKLLAAMGIYILDV